MRSSLCANAVPGRYPTQPCENTVTHLIFHMRFWSLVLHSRPQAWWHHGVHLEGGVMLEALSSVPFHVAGQTSVRAAAVLALLGFLPDLWY